MRKRISSLLVCLLVLSLLAFAVSCGSVKELKVEKEPQRTYVLGSELNLSGGSLSADGKSVSMTSEDVTVEGYDKDKEGEQTLTFTYKGAKAEMSVTVVPRIRTAEQYIYFVGESMDAVALRMRVTKDDGTSFTISAGDEGVTVTGFDSSSAKDALTLHVTCRDAGVDYEGDITVSVLTPGVTFRQPRKTEYGSHEAALDSTGASLTLKNADGKTTRNIKLTDITFEGFDPTLATAENQSVKETIRVIFGGRELATFEITVKYSDVSRIHDETSAMRALDWSHFEATKNDKMYLPEGATEEMGKSAMDLLALWYSLSDKDAAAVPNEDIEAVARLAAIYGYNTWTGAVNRAYENVFKIDVGDITYTCVNRDDAVTGLARLRAAEDDDTKLVLSYGSLLKNAKLTARCGETVIYKGAKAEDDYGQLTDVTLTVADLMTVIYDSTYFNKVASLLEKMINLGDILTVPAEWTTDALADYKTSIDNTYNAVLEIYLNDTATSEVYEIVNNWRENKDLFEILYRFYFSEYKSTDSTVSGAADKKIDKLAELYLPGVMNELYSAAAMAQLMQNFMANAKQSYSGDSGGYPLIMESTYFFVLYDKVVEKSNEVFALKDEMYSALYTRVFSGIVLRLQWGDCGYYDLLGSSALDEASLEVLKAYHKLWLDVDNDESYVLTADFSAKVADMFRAFIELTPNRQYRLLSAINYLYEENRLPSMALYPNDGVGLTSEFASFIYAYFYDILGIDIKATTESDIQLVFENLMIAVETYANGDWDNFGKFMTESLARYDVLSPTDRTKVDDSLGFAMDKYKKILDMFTVTTDDKGNTTATFKQITLDAKYRVIFDKLNAELSQINSARLFIDGYIAELTGQSIPLYVAYLASYERVRTYVDEILASGDENVLRAFYYQPTGDSAELPIFDSVYEAEGAYKRYLLMLGVGEDNYANEDTVNLRKFLSKYADYFWDSVVLKYPSFKGMIGGNFDFSSASLVEMMSEFRALSTYEKYLLYGLDSEQLYYLGIVLYLSNTYPDTRVSTLAYSLMLVEVYHYTYLQDPTVTVTLKDGSVRAVKELLLETWYSFESDTENGYQTLTTEEQAIFDEYFAEMTEYYRGECNKISAEQ